MRGYQPRAKRNSLSWAGRLGGTDEVRSRNTEVAGGFEKQEVV
jgi:hypothetical protein